MERKTVHKVILVFVGSSSLAMAILGTSFNLSLLYAGEPTTIQDVNQAYFINAFYTMTTTCIIFFAILFITGIQLIRGKIFWANILLLIAVIGFIYIFAIGELWLHPACGSAIAAATGIANSALFLQVLTLYIFWAPALAIYVKFNSSNNR